MKHDITRFADIIALPTTRPAPRAISVGACISPVVDRAKAQRISKPCQPRRPHTLRAWLAQEVEACPDDAALQDLIIARGYAIHLGEGGALVCTSDGEPICPLEYIKASGQTSA